MRDRDELLASGVLAGGIFLLMRLAQRRWTKTWVGKVSGAKVFLVHVVERWRRAGHVPATW